MHPSEDELRHHLITRGLVNANVPLTPLSGGNADRAASFRSSWKFQLADGSQARLLLSQSPLVEVPLLSTLAPFQPHLAPRLLLHESLHNHHFLVEEFIEGTPLSHFDFRAGSPALLGSALAILWHKLTATEQESTEPAREAEWAAWCRELLQLLPVSASAKAVFQTTLLPRLYSVLTHDRPPVTRISNGDFTAENIVVCADHSCRVIDWEFGHRTHFALEDAVRLHALSTAARQHPQCFVSIPRPRPAWHLYFWLRQLVLELSQNSAAYLAAHTATRLSTIRQLTESLFGIPLESWPVPAVAVHSAVERVDSGLVSGWCHVPSTPALRAVVAHHGAELIEEVPLMPRPDVRAHFQDADSALLTGFNIPTTSFAGGVILSAQTADGTLLPFFQTPGPVPSATSDGWFRSSPDRWPLISIIIPLFRPPLAFFSRAIETVVNQSYPRWELCLVDDGSMQPELTAFLEQLAATDPRIRYAALPKNQGISTATNAGIAQASGDFVAFLDQDDELTRDALAAVASAILDDPSVDVLYTDQDKVDESGRRFSPFHKPAWAPVYALGVMYVGHLLVARTELVRKIGGCDARFDRVQDFELLLRLSEVTSMIRHIPHILYHWRTLPGSIAYASHAKGQVDTLQVAAVQSYLDRNGIDLDVRPHRKIPHRLELIPPPGAPAPMVSIIVNASTGVARIPRAALELLTLMPIEVLMPQDETASPAPSHPLGLRYLPYEASQDQEHLPSIAAKAARGDFLVFLSPNVAAETADWLSLLLAPLALPKVATTSALVLAPDAHVTGEDPFLVAFSARDADGEGGVLVSAMETPFISPMCSAWRRTTYLELHNDGFAPVSTLERRLAAQGLVSVRVGGARLRLDQPGQT